MAKMLLSSRIKRDAPWYDEHDPNMIIVMLVDCGDYCERWAKSLVSADEEHRELTEELGCTLLPKESPVITHESEKVELIYHYTSTTYKDWCNS